MESPVSPAIAIRDGQVVVRNLSTTRQIDIRERTGLHSLLAVGDTDVISALPVTLVLTGAVRRHGLRLREPGNTATPVSPSPPVDVGGAVTQGVKRLGVTVTSTWVRRRIEEYREKCKRAEIPGLEVDDARPVLAQLVLSLGIITPADLQLLPAR